jgi:nondiscriminating glutamyl-tRNA synthetase
VFDPEKLAWLNRHYMKAAAPARLAAESLRYFVERGFVSRRTDEAMEYVASILPMAVGSVDRLDEIPDRVHFLFDFDPLRSLAKHEVAEVLQAPGAREVLAALAEELATAGRLDRESFRSAANRVKLRTGQKSRALFHPIRIALTGEAGGPELDQAVPAIDRGAELPTSAGVAPIVGCRERAEAFARALQQA